MSYKFVTAPVGYPGKTYTYGNRILEHHLVWWINTGECIDDEYIIHHKNEVKTDNRFENLEKMKRSDHSMLHHLKHKIVCVSCDWCGVTFERTTRKMQGKKSFYCSKKCSAAGALSGKGSGM